MCIFVPQPLLVANWDIRYILSFNFFYFIIIKKKNLEPKEKIEKKYCKAQKVPNFSISVFNFWDMLFILRAMQLFVGAHWTSPGVLKKSGRKCDYSVSPRSFARKWQEGTATCRLKTLSKHITNIISVQYLTYQKIVSAQLTICSQKNYLIWKNNHTKIKRF